MTSLSSTDFPPQKTNREPRRIPNWRRVVVWSVLAGLCVFTLWMSLLPREEVRGWETYVIRNPYFRRTISREWLNWRPEGFAEMAHFVFHLPFGVVVFLAGWSLGRRAMYCAAALAFVWVGVAELSQFYTDDRTPRIGDVLAGWAGIVIGWGFCVLLAQLRHLMWWRRKPREKI